MRVDLDVIAARAMRVRWPNLLLEAIAQLGGALRSARDVVTDVQHARWTRRRREQRVECCDAPRVGRRHVEAQTHILETRLADPADARLERAKCGKE